MSPMCLVSKKVIGNLINFPKKFEIKPILMPDVIVNISLLLMILLIICPIRRANSAKRIRDMKLRSEFDMPTSTICCVR